ncbi:SapC family protein [Lysobacter enzymogenes]|uniref:SapC family protein n=1 Tax=Lysobacter enzymogenes TaxID=69 RepID=UPI001A977493|nr:SapC family protein [Lysobacter enzymogenes]QQP97044.1 SapC family protein [Lysobacter enzymogenes]
MLIYDRVVPLNRDTHRRLRIRTSEHNARFAASLNSVPVATVEFPSAANEYAIVFAKLANGDFLPAVLVGLRNQQNLYVDDSARWRRGYVPAFLRQYPFVLAEDRDSGTVTVCVDMAYDGLSEDEGEPLFGDDGADTENLTRAMGFLQDLHNEFKRTAMFAAKLKELDLLEERVIRFGNGEQPQAELNGVYAVSEEKLMKLDDAQLPELFRTGALGLIYTHLLSMRNLERLSELAVQAEGQGEAGGAVN